MIQLYQQRLFKYKGAFGGALYLCCKGWDQMDLKVKGYVKHNGKWYEPRQELKKVKQEDGKRLIETGVATEIVKAEERKEVPKEPKE